jgi:hypothetical protein
MNFEGIAHGGGWLVTEVDIAIMITRVRAQAGRALQVKLNVNGRFSLSSGCGFVSMRVRSLFCLKKYFITILLACPPWPTSLMG